MADIVDADYDGLSEEDSEDNKIWFVECQATQAMM